MTSEARIDRVLAARIWLLGIAFAALACRNPQTAGSGTSQVADTSADRNIQTEDPGRELEVLLLENYLQLSLGNIEAYADSISQERELMLVGVGPNGTAVGSGQKLDNLDRRPLRARPRCVPGARTERVCLEVLSKRLEVHVYPDQSVGWLSDEISYRVPVDGRLATIPLRMTAVFVRDIDRWTMVMEHTSYALPLSEVMRLARLDGLPIVKRFETKSVGRENTHTDISLARRLVADLTRQLNASTAERKEYRDAMRRKYASARTAAESAADEREDGNPSPGKQSLKDQAPRFIGEEMLVTILPTPGEEYHAEFAHSAQSLSQLFGDRARVTVRNYRYDRAENRRVAWIFGKLLVETEDSESGEKVEIELRGTFLYAFDRYSGWALVQRHISVPVSDDLLGYRTFGPVRPPRRPASAEQPSSAAERASALD